MPMKNKLLLAAILTIALPVLPALAAGEPVRGQKNSHQGDHQDKKADKPAKPVMLPQPATTEPMPHIDPSRFGDKPADEAFGAFQRGLYLTAFNLAKPQAEKGDPASQTLIAEIYARGLGIPANQKLAAEWYEKAANNGVVEAQFRYAALLLQGTYAVKDPVKAEELMKKAAEGGNAMAQFNYGQMLMEKRRASRASISPSRGSRRRPGPRWPMHNMHSARFMPTVPRPSPRRQESARLSPACCRTGL